MVLHHVLRTCNHQLLIIETEADAVTLLLCLLVITLLSLRSPRIYMFSWHCFWHLIVTLMCIPIVIMRAENGRIIIQTVGIEIRSI